MAEATTGAVMKVARTYEKDPQGAKKHSHVFKETETDAFGMPGETRVLGGIYVCKAIADRAKKLRITIEVIE